MSERYSKLFTLPENLYTTGAPAVIAAGALLKDNQSGNVLAQLKLQNINSRRIKAATVQIFPMDTAGDAIDETATYQYLDLNAGRDEFFGQKTAIPLPNAATRSFSVIVTEIIFSNNEKWVAEEAKWRPLKKPTSIGWGDPELVKQFHRDYGGYSNNMLLEDTDLWICVCGAINRSGETCCHRCGQTLDHLRDFNIDDLRKRKDERLVLEAAAEKKRLEKRQHNIRIAKIVSAVLAAVAALCITIRFISKTVEKNNAYNNAASLMAQGEYEQAIAGFQTLGNYKDSTEQIKEAEHAIALKAEEAEHALAYDHAIQLLNSDDPFDHNEAHTILCELGDYKDSIKLLQDFLYLPLSAEYSGSSVSVNNGTHLFQYDDYGRLIREESPYQDYNYVYDESGKLVEEGSSDFTTTYRYNPNNTLSFTRELITIDSSGKKMYTETTYDENGYPLTIKNDYWPLDWTFQYQKGSSDSYDAVEISTTRWDQQFSIVLNLNDYDRNKLCQEATSSFPTFWVTSADGKETACYELDLNADIYLKACESYKYDDQQNVIKKVTFDRIGKQDTVFNYKNTYDDANNLIKVEWEAVGGTSKRVCEYKYGYIYAPNAK